MCAVYVGGPHSAIHSRQTCGIQREVHWILRSVSPNSLQGDFHVLIAFEARELLSPLYQ